MRREKIGLLGGSFNPVHKGHLEVARVVFEKLFLDKVFLVPAACSPFKTSSLNMTGADSRLKMLELAVSIRDNIFIDDFELQHPAPSYTFYTLQHYSKKNAEIFFIVGTDAFNSISKWHRFEELFDLAHFVVVRRENHPFEPLKKVLPTSLINQFFQKSHSKREWLNVSGHKIIYLDYDFPDIQSLKVREKIAKEESIGNLVTHEVEEFIKSHHLYQSGKEELT